MNLSDLYSGIAPPHLTPPAKQTRRVARVHRVHDKDYRSSTSTHEEFLQYIIIENIPI